MRPLTDRTSALAMRPLNSVGDDPVTAHKRYGNVTSQLLPLNDILRQDPISIPQL